MTILTNSLTQKGSKQKTIAQIKKTEKQALWISLWSFFPKQIENLSLLEKRLSYTFKNKNLFFEAFTHRSAITWYEQHVLKNLKKEEEHNFRWNEKLEFLGDSVLNFIITNYLWNNAPDLNEGQLSKQRSQLVKEETLVSVAKTLDLKNILITGPELMVSDQIKSEALLADSLEALLGALFLDAGQEKCQKLLIELWQPFLKNPSLLEFADSKTCLQEFCQEKFLLAPLYKLIKEEGDQHKKTFLVGVFLKEKKIAQAHGTTKKKASQLAALQAMIKLKKINSKSKLRVKI